MQTAATDRNRFFKLNWNQSLYSVQYTGLTTPDLHGLCHSATPSIHSLTRQTDTDTHTHTHTPGALESSGQGSPQVEYVLSLPLSPLGPGIQIGSLGGNTVSQALSCMKIAPGRSSLVDPVCASPGQQPGSEFTGSTGHEPWTCHWCCSPGLPTV